MSQLSEKVRKALFAAMNVPSVTNLATGGVYHKVAPEEANSPLIVFSRMSNITNYAFGLVNTSEDDLWMIKSLSDKDSSSTQEPQELNAGILAAAEATIGKSLTLAGGQTFAVYRTNDIPEMTEIVGDRIIYHNGFFLRVVSANT